MNFWHMAVLNVSYLALIFGLVRHVKAKQEASKDPETGAIKWKGYDISPFPNVHNLHLVLLSLYMWLGILHEAWKNGYSLFSNGVDQTDAGYPVSCWRRSQGVDRAWARRSAPFPLRPDLTSGPVLCTDGPHALDFLCVQDWRVPRYGQSHQASVCIVDPAASSRVVMAHVQVIMALKGNFHQITFLHVYHHSSIFFVWWIIVRFAPGGDGVLLLLLVAVRPSLNVVVGCICFSAYFSAQLNSFIHVVMYSYYMWSTFAPKVRNVRPCSQLLLLVHLWCCVALLSWPLTPRRASPCDPSGTSPHTTRSGSPECR